MELTQAQNHRPIPLVGDLNSGRNNQGQNKSPDSNPDGLRVSRNPEFGVRECRAHA
jgi:hypothetical protein